MTNDETANREVVKNLTVWCKDNNLSLNVIKTKGDDCGLQEKEDRTRQSLFPLRRLKRFGMGPQILKRFCSCTTTWYGNCSASDRKALQSRGRPINRNGQLIRANFKFRTIGNGYFLLNDLADSKNKIS
jgi:hypothetical protein